MRRYLAVLGFTLALGVAAAVWPTRYYWEMATCPTGAGTNCVATPQPCDAGVCNGAAPTSSTQGLALSGVGASGIPINGVTAYKLTVRGGPNPDGGTQCTLSGAGSMLAYQYDWPTAEWSRSPNDDAPIPASCAGLTACKVLEVETGARFDKVYYRASGVTVGCGTGLDTMLSGQHQETH